MIQINKIEPQVIEHFEPSGNSLGFLNEYESTDLRCLIAEHSVEGYYLIIEDEKRLIDNNGRIKDWNNLYETSEILLGRLIRVNHKQNE